MVLTSALEVRNITAKVVMNNVNDHALGYINDEILAAASKGESSVYIGAQFKDVEALSRALNLQGYGVRQTLDGLEITW